jgi:hypothetical protein
MNSLQRYYLNNFLDADRQEGVDLLTGHELFGNVNEIDGSGDTISLGNSVGTRITIHEAARQLLLGTNDIDEKDDKGRNHVRIKSKNSGKILKSNPSIRHGAVRSTQYLDLRWLPGDLQSQVRKLISSSDEISDDSFKSREHLQAIDDRAASDTPWWVVDSPPSEVNSANSTSPSTTAVSPVYETDVTSASNLAYVLGAFIAGTKAPLAVASVVIGIVATSFPWSNQESKL